MRMRLEFGVMACFVLVGSIGWGQPTQAFGGVAHDRSKPVTMITFVATIRGISPPVMTLPAGRYMFRLRNAVTKDPLTFAIADDKAAKRADVAVKKDESRGHAFFDLDAGQYDLRVAGAPDGMKATIVVNKP